MLCRLANTHNGTKKSHCLLGQSQNQLFHAVLLSLRSVAIRLYHTLRRHASISTAGCSFAVFYFFQCFNSGTTASIWALTCSAGQLSLAMCVTQKSISCSLLVYLNVPSV